MSQTSSGAKRANWLQRSLQVRVGTMILIVAGAALITEAWKYYRDNINPDRAMTTSHIRALGDPDPGRRMLAAHALRDIKGSDMRRAVQALLEALRDREPGVRAAAANALSSVILRNVDLLQGDVKGEVDAATLALVVLLEDRDARCREAAARALGSLVIPGQSVSPARPGNASAGPLGYAPIAPDLNRVLPALRRAAHDPEPLVRALALFAIGQLSDTRADAPAILLDALTSDPDPDVHYSALDALIRPWRNHDEIYATLVNEIINQPAKMKFPWTNLWRYRLGPAPAREVPGLVVLLKQDDPEVKQIAVTILSQTGPVAIEAVPEILTIARSEPDGTVPAWDRFVAVQAVLRIAPPDSPEVNAVVPVLVSFATERPKPNDPFDAQIRVQAANLLRSMGTAVVPALRAAADGRDPEARAVAEKMLRAINPE